MTPKGKSIFGKIKDFVKGGLDEMKKTAQKNDDESDGNQKGTTT
jgi:hypothetical protein